MSTAASERGPSVSQPQQATFGRTRKLADLPTARCDATMAVVYRGNDDRDGSNHSRKNAGFRRRKKPAGVLVLGGTTPADARDGNTTMDFFEWKTKRWWTFPSSLQSERSGCASATIDSVTYVCGGTTSTAQQHFDTVHTFDFATQTWSELASPMSTPRSYPAVCVARIQTDDNATLPVLWVCGGRNQHRQELASCEYYVPALGQWKRPPAATLRTPRFACTAVAVQNQSRIMVVGGFDGVRWLASVEMYYLHRQLWYRSCSDDSEQEDDPEETLSMFAVAPLPVPLSFPQSTVIQLSDGTSCVVCVGGTLDHDQNSYHGNNNNNNNENNHRDTSQPVSCYAYFQAENVWKPLPLQYNFEGALVASVGDTLFVVGGRFSTNITNDDNLVNRQNVVSFRLSGLSPSADTMAACLSTGLASVDIHDDPVGDTPRNLVAPTKSIVSRDTISTSTTTSSSSSINSSSQKHQYRAHRHPPNPPPGQKRDHAMSPKRTRSPGVRPKRRVGAPSTPVSEQETVVDFSPSEVLSSIFVPSAFPAYDQDYLSLASTTGMETITTDSQAGGSDRGDDHDLHSNGAGPTDANSLLHNASFSSASSAGSFSPMGNLDKPKLRKNTSVPTKYVEEYPTTDSQGHDVYYTGSITVTFPRRPHGHGTMRWVKSKNTYTGEFDVEGNRHGRGLMTYYNRRSGRKDDSVDATTYDTYDGMFCKDQKYGKGVYTWKSGKQYEGNYRNGKPDDPNGTLTFPDGSIYMGTFRNGERTGRGILHLATGRYQGDFVNGKYHGYGTMIFTKKQQEYTGYFRNGKAHGQGRLLSLKTKKVLYQGVWYEDAPDIKNMYKEDT